ncbi:MAG: hypothetical protein LQ343_000774 [Gyalolechia ehrenbergii]|nr:MAG: hypothetical protein LQ343_000774 [Gyalolechia ehrenbergii]
MKNLISVSPLSLLSTIIIILLPFLTSAAPPPTPTPYAVRNFHLPVDTPLLYSLHTSFTDALTLIRTIVEQKSVATSPIFDSYFPPQARSDVTAEFERMYSSGVFRALAFDNSDQVDGKDGQKRLICDANTIAAYTLNEDGGEHPRIHVCGRSWGYFPRLGELDVGKVCAGERVSEA